MSSESLYSNITLALFGTIFLSLSLRAVYQLLFSPLSAVPGPWYAAVSDFWLTTHVLRLQQCKILHTLFERYGPVVRVGPNKVVFCDANSTRAVYSRFDKSSYYKSLLTNENDHAMTTLDHSSHAIRRKGYAPHYSMSNLAQFQPEMHDCTLELVNILEGMTSQTPVDCLSLFRHLMVDVFVASSYGYQVGALGKWAADVEDVLCTAVHDFPIRGIIRSALPHWAWNLVCKIPNNRWRQITDSDRIMAEFASARVYEIRAQMNAGKLDETEKVTLLQRLLEHRPVGSNDFMHDRDVISEAMGHLIATADTTSTSLSYWFWELSRRPDVMRKLQAELDIAIPDAHSIPDISVLQKLPYLNAFIKEGLRLYNAAPSLLERVVPKSASKGNSLSEAFDLMGYELPPGTIIGTQAWSMHRCASIFPSPEAFLPDRWLEADDGALALMTRNMMPFGAGSRICGGQNLAHFLLRITVAAVARNFDIFAPKDTSETTMEIKDSFIIFPASMKCKLIFSPRKI